MLQKTAAYIKQYQMAKPGEKMVIGLSGGRDSVCLFYILKELGYALEAVHVNHGIRGEEADRDEKFVKTLCEKYEIPFHGYHFDVPKISRKEHRSEEETGRMVRRQAFLEVLEKSGAAHIALAHHGNDRAETLLFHLSRGTGIRGLSSMRPVEGVYIRPLLWSYRAQIEAYVENMEYEFVEDGTNASVDYTRNKIRHEILPLLEEVNPKSVVHISRAAEKLSAVADYMDRMAEKLYQKSVTREKKEVRISKEILFSGDPVLYVPVFQKSVEYLDGSLADMTEEHWEKMKNLFEMQTGKKLSLPRGLLAVRTYEGIRLFYEEEILSDEPVKITGEGTYSFGGNTFLIRVEDWDESKMFSTKSYTKCFDYDKISKGICLRTREAGDYLEINKDHGKKSLQDYLVNEKVAKEERNRMVLLADGSHILWVVGKRISEYYKVSKDTKKILKVQLCGGNEYEFYSERIDLTGRC